MRNDNDMRHQVLATANRLRLIHTDSSDEEQQVRAGYLCEEIDRALKRILPGARREFLEALAERFPAGDFGAAQVPQQPESQDDQGVIEDPDYLVDLLLKVAPSLTVDNKNSIAERLREAGIGSSEPRVYSDEALQRLKSAVKLGDAVSIDANQVIELAVSLIEFVCGLERVVGGVWRKLSPQSKVRASEDVRRSLHKLLSSGDEASPDEFAHNLTVLHQLIAFIISAIGQVGSQIARRHFAQFSPSEISALVKMEGVGVWKSEKVKYWEKYCELADGLTEDSVDLGVRRIIADYVESSMKRMGG